MILVTSTLTDEEIGFSFLKSKRIFSWMPLEYDSAELKWCGVFAAHEDGMLWILGNITTVEGSTVVYQPKILILVCFCNFPQSWIHESGYIWTHKIDFWLSFHIDNLGLPWGAIIFKPVWREIANRCKRSCSMAGVSHKKKNRHPTKSPSNDHVYLCLDNISLFSCSFVEATLSCMQSSFVLKNT